MTDDSPVARQTLTIQDGDLGHLARVVDQWLGEGFSVSGETFEFASRLLLLLEHMAASRRV